VTEIAQPRLQRYLALDAYRGFIMLMLVSHGFGFGELQGDPTYGRIASRFEHEPWEWISFWDLVQPGFMYIVGVAMPFALAIRTQRGVYSAAWVLLGMLVFYVIVEMKQYRKWTHPLVVIGANSIFIYAVSGWILRGWLERVVGVLTGDFLFIETLAPVAKTLAVLAVMYSMNDWLYKRKIFLKV